MLRHVRTRAGGLRASRGKLSLELLLALGNHRREPVHERLGARVHVACLLAFATSHGRLPALIGGFVHQRP